MEKNRDKCCPSPLNGSLNSCCEEISVQKNENRESSERDNVDECGCACGQIEYQDLSEINNPDSPEKLVSNGFLNDFKNYAQSVGISSVGYTQITPQIMIRNKDINYSHVIVLTTPINEEIINTEPGSECKSLNDALYAEFGAITYKISDYLRKHGYATEVVHPDSGDFNFSLLGQTAGLGWIGNSGLLIIPEFGPSIKLSAIMVNITNLPLIKYNEHSWISDYCNRCSECIKACPENALEEKETCSGVKKTNIISNLCIGCIQGCTYCIEACPFHKKGYGPIKDKFDKLNTILEEKENKCC